MSHKLILFNGPPRSGKDTAVNHLLSKYCAAGNYSRIYGFKFSQPIKDAVKATFALTQEEVQFAEAHKDEPLDLFFGETYRNVQISFSEDWLKKGFGPNVFGELAKRRVDNAIRLDPTEEHVFLCSDSGFASEAKPLVEYFGPENVTLVHVFAPGKTFAGDSRSYINLSGLGVTTLPVHNSRTIEDYKALVEVLFEWLTSDWGS